MSDDIRVGMDWMEAAIHRLGQSQGSRISPLGWDADTVDDQGGRHFLVLLLNGQREVLTLNDVELEDLPDDPRLQIEVEGAIRALFNDAFRGSPLGC